jgi:hypothetical protein
VALPLDFPDQIESIMRVKNMPVALLTPTEQSFANSAVMRV